MLISKQNNEHLLLHQTPYTPHARTKQKLTKYTNFHCQHTHTHTHPTPQSNGQVPKFQCWLEDTRQFHFCLDKSALLYDFSPIHFHSRSNCINIMQQSIQSFCFLSPCTDWIVCIIIIHMLQTRNPWNSWVHHQITSYYSIKQKIKEYNNIWRRIFHGPGVKTTLTLKSLMSQHDLHFADHVVPGWRKDIYF